MPKPKHVHYRPKGDKFQICGVIPGRQVTTVPGETTCASCIYKMQKRGIKGTPEILVSKPGRPQRTKVKNITQDIAE
jgi:hypothetical protein